MRYLVMRNMVSKWSKSWPHTQLPQSDSAAGPQLCSRKCHG